MQRRLLRDGKVVWGEHNWGSDQVVRTIQSSDASPVLSEPLELVAGVLMRDDVFVDVHIAVRRGLVDVDVFFFTVGLLYLLMLLRVVDGISAFAFRI